jgi:hypothetical protein
MYGINPDQIYEATLTELLELFKENDSITVKELYAHVTKLYTEDKKFDTKKLTTETEILSDALLADDSTSRPWGQYGEVTLNQIGVALKENLKDIN